MKGVRNRIRVGSERQKKVKRACGVNGMLEQSVNKGGIYPSFTKSNLGPSRLQIHMG